MSKRFWLLGPLSFLPYLELLEWHSFISDGQYFSIDFSSFCRESLPHVLQDFYFSRLLTNVHIDWLQWLVFSYWVFDWLFLYFYWCYPFPFSPVFVKHWLCFEVVLDLTELFWVMTFIWLWSKENAFWNRSRIVRDWLSWFFVKRMDFIGKVILFIYITWLKVNLTILKTKDVLPNCYCSESEN